MGGANALVLQPGHSSLQQYLAAIAKYPLIQRDEEMTLARNYRDTGDVQAAHKLVVSHLRFVVQVAKGYRHYGMRLLDLIQEGNVGLMLAVKKFDPERGFRLLTYAVFWIKAAIQDYVLRSWSLVRMGAGKIARKLFFKLRSERSRLEQEARRSIGIEELAAHFQMEVETVRGMQLRLQGKDHSLQAPVHEDNPASAQDLLPDDTLNPEERLIAEQEQHNVRQALAQMREQLNPKEQALVRKRLLTDEPTTLDALGKQFVVTRERMRQIEQKVLEKLKLRLQQQTGNPAQLPA